mmetsp:Transcript_37975/g.68382  ORF Transcript_37975/g.68382 Transcript_37975/m.68382 type:complete len:80 (-) Transcript_37975:1015-1254(-)
MTIQSKWLFGFRVKIAQVMGKNCMIDRSNILLPSIVICDTSISGLKERLAESGGARLDKTMATIVDPFNLPMREELMLT